MRHLPRPSNAADCWDKLDAEQAKLDVAKANRDKKKADMAKRQPSSKESKAYTATIASNKALAAAAAASDSDYSTCHASLHGCVFDQEFVPHTPGTVLDSGAQVNILEGTLGSGTRIQLTGITGATTEAERADAVFPVIAADGSRHAISIRGKNILLKADTKSIFALARTLTSRMEVTCTRQRINLLLSYSQAISGGFQCGAHPHDVRVLPVSLLIKILSLRL